MQSAAVHEKTFTESLHEKIAGIYGQSAALDLHGLFEVGAHETRHQFDGRVGRKGCARHALNAFQIRVNEICIHKRLAMAHWTEEQGIEALATISTLKRAMGIPNHPTKIDTIIENDFHIYTSDEESAQLIGELLYRYGNGRRAA